MGEIKMGINIEDYGSTAFLRKLYDAVRVVDPLEKKIMTIGNYGDVSEKSSCYKLLEKRFPCENCISMRSYLDHNTYAKIEYNKGKALLITAAPIIQDGKILIVETMKNISANTKYFDSARYKQKALKNVINELNNKITRDSLTGVYKKSLINEKLIEDINDSFKKGNPLSVIMADIDCFYKVNESFGNLTGDKVLRDFSNLLNNSIHKNKDWIGRYDGEKFIISLKKTEGEAAYKLTEKIRKLTEKTTFSYDNAKINITSSFGVYSIKNIKMDVNKLISETDKNLYTAKASGKNKVIFGI